MVIQHIGRTVSSTRFNHWANRFATGGIHAHINRAIAHKAKAAATVISCGEDTPKSAIIPSTCSIPNRCRLSCSWQNYHESLSRARRGLPMFAPFAMAWGLYQIRADDCLHPNKLTAIGCTRAQMSHRQRCRFLMAPVSSSATVTLSTLATVSFNKRFHG